MNIAIDITPLQTGHKNRGVGIYTKLLIEALQEYENGHSYHFFVRGQKVPSNDFRNKIVLGKPKNIDIVHYPYFDPFFVTLPLFYQKPTVITIHDLIPLVFPQRFPAGIRGTLKWQYQRTRLAQARRVIADSEASRRDIEHIASISALRIDVIHLAPSPQYRVITDRSLLSRVKKKYGLPDTFILYVGDVNWNKNVLGLLKAFQRITYHVSRITLVLVGKAFLEDSNEAREIAGYITHQNLGDEVMRIGGVSAEDLVAIYNLASVYIQPSFYEGFGLPVLEAMACGTPVVSTRVSSLAEIAGPAIAVDTSDPKDIARGLLEALTMTPAKRSELVSAQSKWVQQFSWERVAHQTIMSYEKALA